jgi:YD repeat-containing protein
VNGANTVNFTYDLDGLLTGAHTTVNGSAVNFTINRDAQNGLITGSSIGGVSDSISYNGFAEPIGYNATFNGSSLYNVSYVRDSIGRISSKTETVNGVATTFDYHYDLAGRLTGVDKNGVPSSSYTYDSNGNRLSYSGELGSFAGTYDAQDRLLSYGDFVYEYTANGELRRKEDVVTGEVTTYQFDAMGNLMHVTLPNGTSIDYVLDGKNRRIGKKVNGTLVESYLYGSSRKIVAVLVMSV